MCLKIELFNKLVSLLLLNIWKIISPPEMTDNMKTIHMGFLTKFGAFVILSP